jgi:hypothetical protein
MKPATLLSLALASSVSAGVHRLKLQKIAPESPDHFASLSSVAQLGQKYGVQMPMVTKPLSRNGEDDLYWSQVVQDPLKGGHSVPLSSESFDCSSVVSPDS